MNSRDRVYAAIEFDSPDRIPHMHSYRTATLNRYGHEFNKLLERFPSDFYHPPRSKDSLEGSDAGVMTDEWGVAWVKIQDGFMGQPRGYPLTSWENLSDYEVPDPDPAKSVALRHHGGREDLASGDLYACMYGGSIFERLQQLRGMRKLFFDLASGRRELGQLADLIVDYNIRLSRIWLERGADAIVFTDDWGTQQELMISPPRWREFFKPRYRKMFRAVHREGAKVHFHSDGTIIQIIPDLVELGVDVLNPQLNAHDPDQLTELCSGHICIRGGLDRQGILPRGSQVDVQQHALEALGRFALHDGGWIACGELGPDVPLVNCETMMRTFSRFGRYRP
jgi:hypothetical protein